MPSDSSPGDTIELLGRPEPPLAPRPLRAGELSAELAAPDLAEVRLGGLEVVRLLGVRVRDEHWGTIPPEVSDLEVEEGGDATGARWSARHEAGALALAWTGKLELRGRSLTYEMAARAERAFPYNRIGIVVLHPPAVTAGRPFRARTPSGEIAGTLPARVGPQRIVDGEVQPLFAAFTRLEVELAADLRAVFELEGDVFEMEDQRNWTDGSFKTYSTPVGLPVPHRIEAGQEIVQRVRVELSGAARPRPARAPGAPVALRLGAPLGRALPPLGVGLDADGHELTPAEVARLRELAPAHLRADVRAIAPGSHPGGDGERGSGAARDGEPASGASPGSAPGSGASPGSAPGSGASAGSAPGSGASPGSAGLGPPVLGLGAATAGAPALARHAAAAAAIGAPLELAVVLEGEEAAARAGLRALAEVLRTLRPPLARVLVHHASELVTSAAWGELARELLAPDDVPLVGGTPANFAELNREPPPPQPPFAALAYAVTPQVHDTDERSLVQSLAAQADTVATAHEHGGGRPVHVTPVTLKPRFNPYAKGPEPAPEPGALPPQVDPRQASRFLAAWTLGSAKRLAEAGAATVTYFEATGWRGVLEREEGSPLPERFRSRPGEPFPVWAVLRALCAWRGAPVLACASEDPLAVEALAVEGPALLVANLRPEAATAQVAPWPRAGARVTSLAGAADDRGVAAGTLTLALDPYAVARVEPA